MNNNKDNQNVSRETYYPKLQKLTYFTNEELELLHVVLLTTEIEGQDSYTKEMNEKIKKLRIKIARI